MYASSQSLTERLDALAQGPAGEADLDRAALHLLDWIGCALAGSVTLTGRGMLSVLAPDGRPFALAGPESAMALGSLGSLLEMDDVHRTALLHPGPVVMPSVLALARGAQSKQCLEAMLAGYEAMIRLGQSVGLQHYRYFHNTATCGAIGAAMAAARMLALPPDQTVWAMGHAMSLSGGLWQCRNEPGMTKHLHVAEAARRGVQAALLAGAGLAGPRLILEGPQGFFVAFAPDGSPERVVRSEAGWRMAEVSFKPWPACRHAHPAIDAALALRPKLNDRPIVALRIETYSDAVRFCDKPEPVTEAEAKFSLQHSVAIALARGAPELRDFENPQAASNQVATLRRAARVGTLDRLTAAYPAHFGARVEIDLDSGEKLAAEVSDAWGDPEIPMDAAAVIAKFRMLSRAAFLTWEETEAILLATLALPSGGTTDALLAALSAINLPRGQG